MKIKARIIEKESLEQMYNIRYNFHNGSQKGKMNWDLVELNEVMENLDNDNVMVFTQKFGEVDKTDISKFDGYLNKK